MRLTLSGVHQKGSTSQAERLAESTSALKGPSWSGYVHEGLVGWLPGWLPGPFGTGGCQPPYQWVSLETQLASSLATFECIDDEVADSGPSKDARRSENESASRPDDAGITAATPDRFSDGDQPTVLLPFDRRDGPDFRHAGETVTARPSAGPQA